MQTSPPAPPPSSRRDDLEEKASLTPAGTSAHEGVERPASSRSCSPMARTACGKQAGASGPTLTQLLSPPPASRPPPTSAHLGPRTRPRDRRRPRRGDQRQRGRRPPRPRHQHQAPATAADAISNTSPKTPPVRRTCRRPRRRRPILGGVGTPQALRGEQPGETDCMRVDARIDERTLRETHFPAFETTVRKAQPWTVMCSYNKDGTYASQNRELLTQILREEWGFEGLVVSDWGAVDQRPRPRSRSRPRNARLRRTHRRADRPRRPRRRTRRIRPRRRRHAHRHHDPARRRHPRPRGLRRERPPRTRPPRRSSRIRPPAQRGGRGRRRALLRPSAFTEDNPSSSSASSHAPPDTRAQDPPKSTPSASTPSSTRCAHASARKPWLSPPASTSPKQRAFRTRTGPRTSTPGAEGTPSPSPRAAPPSSSSACPP